jgi:CheY-like chemotaxis protein
MATPKTILVVDDEPCARYLLQSLLAKTGCAVVTTVDGPQALAVASSQAVHLLVTDVIMKGMDGFELARALRVMPAYASLPVIMLSARWQIEYRTEAPLSENIVMMTKPFSPIELRSQVNLLLKL